MQILHALSMDYTCHENNNEITVIFHELTILLKANDCPVLKTQNKWHLLRHNTILQNIEKSMTLAQPKTRTIFSSLCVVNGWRSGSGKMWINLVTIARKQREGPYNGYKQRKKRPCREINSPWFFPPHNYDFSLSFFWNTLTFYVSSSLQMNTVWIITLKVFIEWPRYVLNCIHDLSLFVKFAFQRRIIVNDFYLFWFDLDSLTSQRDPPRKISLTRASTTNTL